MGEGGGGGAEGPGLLIPTVILAQLSSPVFRL